MIGITDRRWRDPRRRRLHDLHTCTLQPPLAPPRFAMKHSPEHIAARSASKRQKAQERREQPSNGTTWREQFEAGQCLARAAEAMGQSVWQGRRWAQAAGVTWPDGRTLIEHRTAIGTARRRRFQEDEAFRERELARMAKIRPCTRPAHNRRLNMTEAERETYDLMRSKKFKADEAATMIGRPDLTRRAMLARHDLEKALRQIMAQDAAASRARVRSHLHGYDARQGRRKGKVEHDATAQ